MRPKKSSQEISEPDAATCYDFVRYVAEEIQGKKAD